MKKLIVVILALALVIPNYANAEKSTYLIMIDEHSYNLEYEVDADVLAMAIDRELTSFLIGIENTKDSVLSIKLPSEMISAENNKFAVLVDGLEVDYSISSEGDFNEISVFVPEGSQEIEIIGTKVIPEFPLGLLLVFGSVMTLYVIVTKHKRFRLLPY